MVGSEAEIVRLSRMDCDSPAPGLFRVLSPRRRRRQRRSKAESDRIRLRAAPATPIPMPAFAPVLKPGDDAEDGLDTSPAVGEGVENADEIKEDDLKEDDLEEADFCGVIVTVIRSVAVTTGDGKSPCLEPTDGGLEG